MKELKRLYRQAFLGLKELKSEASYNQKAIDTAKMQLVADFEVWYSDTFSEEMLPDSGVKQTSAVPAKKRDASPGKVSHLQFANLMQMIHDPLMDEDLDQTLQQQEREGVDVDNDALAYIRARKNVLTLDKAKKFDRL